MINIGDLCEAGNRIFRIADIRMDQSGNYAIIGLCLNPLRDEQPMWLLHPGDVTPITVH